ncbi:hypothetical protein MKX03_002673 [Papaver bracteatum]|nr:hypothetical protein MKX03_002673 [Papaver bracteatum]
MAKISGSTFVSFFFVLAILSASQMATTEAQLTCDTGKLVILGGPCTKFSSKCLKKFPVPLIVTSLCVPLLGTPVCAFCVVEQAA